MGALIFVKTYEAQLAPDSIVGAYNAHERMLWLDETGVLGICKPAITALKKTPPNVEMKGNNEVGVELTTLRSKNQKFKLTRSSYGTSNTLGEGITESLIPTGSSAPESARQMRLNPEASAAQSLLEKR